MEDQHPMQDSAVTLGHTPKRKGPRLSHRKSRTGCQRCRARRVKCDETRPVCRDCHRHGVPCLYDRPVQTSNLRSEQQAFSAAKSHSTGVCRDPPTSSAPRHPSSIELRLLHHFTVGTSSTLPGTHLPSVKDCWSIDVPKLAFDYKPLLYAIFAISAFHLVKTEHCEVELLDIRRDYLEQALREHRLSVGSISPKVADAACFTSILLLLDAFSTLQDRPLAPYEPPVKWMQLVRGSVSVFDAALDAITDKSPKILSIIESSPLFMEPKSAFGLQNIGHFSYLQPAESPDEQDDDVDVYGRTIAYINAIWCAVEAKEHTSIICRRLMVFPLFVPPDFIKFLQERRPRALVVLAHFIALSAPLSNIWWIGHTAHKEVLAILAMLTPEWIPLMAWPIDTVTSRCWICTRA